MMRELTTTILLIEDNPGDARLLREMLKEESSHTTHLTHVQCMVEAEAYLAGNEIDVILLDLGLPDAQGFAAIRRARAAAPQVPLVVLTGMDDESLAYQALQVGAQDYLIKGEIEARGLHRAMRYAIERNVSDEALRESEVRFRQITEAIRDVFFVVDLENTHMFYVSPAYADIWGRTCESLYAEPDSWRDSIHPDDRAFAKRKFTECKGTDFDYEYRIIRPDGAVRWVRLRGFPIKDAAGLPYRTAGVASDVSARKLAEEEQKRLMMATEYAAESIMVTDSLGVIEYVNPEFERITGYTREEAVGANPRFLNSGQQDSAFFENMWDTLNRGEVWSGHMSNKRKDGTLYDEDSTISVVLDHNGSIRNFVAIKRDVSERVELERRLRQAQKMEAIGTLAGGIAHDFNNILGAIIGFSEIAILQLGPENPVETELNTVLGAAHRATELVRQILLFSRKAENERKPVRMELIAKEVLDLMRATLPSTIEISSRVDDGAGLVLADPSQMHQILMNLCTNAFHAMRDTGGTLNISVGPFHVESSMVNAFHGMHEGMYSLTSVTDSGPGISKEILDRIFEPFFTTKAEGEGTGLGLSTVHGIVASHGGQVTAYSELGAGTTFHVYLPLHEIEGAEPPAQADPPLGGNEHILVVDDEVFLVRLLEFILQDLGYTVKGFTSSMDALACFRANPAYFDLVLTDLTMPRMTGEQLIRQMKRIRNDIPVILSTGYLGNRSIEEFATMGVADVVSKPAKRSEIARVVRLVLDRTQGHKRPLADTSPRRLSEWK